MGGVEEEEVATVGMYCMRDEKNKFQKRKRKEIY